MTTRMKCIICIELLLVLTCFPKVNGDTLDNVTDLYDSLFVHAKYNRNIRGVKDQTTAVKVGANFSLSTLVDVMEKEEAFEVMGLLHLSWTDERLVWNTNDFNGTKMIVVYQEMVWKPEIKLANPMFGVKSLGSERTQITIFHDGKVFWLTPDVFQATCSIDVVSFPWDRQSCDLEFVVAGHTPDQVFIEVESDDIDIRKFTEDESWTLLKTSAVSSLDTISIVQFWFCLERRSSFYISVVFAPVLTLSILNTFVFFVKVDSGERISFSITLLLSITLYLSTIASNLPTHSKGMSAIIYCLNFVLGESTLICVMSIYSLHVYHKVGKPSYKCQVIVRMLLGRNCRKIQDKENACNINTSSEEEIPEDKKKQNEQPSNDYRNLGISWTDVSLLIDRIFFCLSSCAILSSFMIFTYYVVSSRRECV